MVNFADRTSIMEIAKEILINAFLVSTTDFLYDYIPKNKVQFEFILNNNLELLDCIKLQTASSKKNFIVTEIANLKEIYNSLFEINHVRIDPHQSNFQIISKFTKVLTDLGVRIHNPPSKDSLALCFRPLGEIKDNVRFYIKEDHNVVFLAKTARPKLIRGNRP